jgi:hypothetical protein
MTRAAPLPIQPIQPIAQPRAAKAQTQSWPLRPAQDRR